MPRRGSPSASRSSSRGNVSPRSNAPPPGKGSPQSQQQQQNHPGLLKQSAAIAGGVAAGSVIGHTIGHALTGGYRDRDREYYEQRQQEGSEDPCANEISAFLKCTNEQKDISICAGFNEAIKQCRKYGASAISSEKKQ